VLALSIASVHTPAAKSSDEGATRLLRAEVEAINWGELQRIELMDFHRSITNGHDRPERHLATPFCFSVIGIPGPT
jgi:hypothetical protein